MLMNTENNGKALIPLNSNELVATTAKQIAITDKILFPVSDLATKQKELLEFLLNSDIIEEFSKPILYRFYPFSESFIRNNLNKIEWEEIKFNQSIKWGSDILELIPEIIPIKLQENLLLDDDLLESHTRKWNWHIIIRNKSFPWSDKWIDSLDKEELSDCIYLPWSSSILNKHLDKWNWWKLCENSSLPWTEDFINEFKDNIVWYPLSRNESLPWSKNLFLFFQAN